MGLSNFPSASEGVLPVLVLNTLISVALLKNIVTSLLQAMGATWTTTFTPADSSSADIYETRNYARGRRISITKFKSLCHRRHRHRQRQSVVSAGANNMSVECCVCLCGFEADEEVSELSCKHFFHKGCLDKWFDNNRSTCPLCRSLH